VTVIESDGTLGAVVWPAHVGAIAAGELTIGEPDSADYRRGQITWQVESGEVVGRAQILLPAGTYTHLCYFRTPSGPSWAGAPMQLQHPVVMDTAGVLDVYPIKGAG